MSFSEVVGRKLGNGAQPRFWHDRWVGTGRLKELFPRLYQLTEFKDGKVADMGEWSGEIWNWKWRWRCDFFFFAWEVDLFNEFQDCLMQVSFSNQVLDSWCWKPDISGCSRSYPLTHCCWSCKVLCHWNVFVMLAISFGNAAFHLRFQSLFGGCFKIGCLQGICF